MSNNDVLKNIIVYTGVYYTDTDIYKSRSQIWFKTFDNALKLNIKMVVRNDGGLPIDMLNKIRAYPNITIINKENKNDTLGEGRRWALKKAMDIAETENLKDPVFIWTEPEKDSLITEANLLRMFYGIRDGMHIIIPERGNKAWGQLPAMQKWLEQRANKRVQGIGGSKEVLDFWFGPKVFDCVGAEYFLQYNSDGNKVDLWDSLMVPILIAIKTGDRVGSVLLDFSYNESQTKTGFENQSIEIQIKRLEQYTQILKELGDPLWQKFFEEAQGKLDEIKKLGKISDDNRGKIQEIKQALLKGFFRIK